MNDLDLLEAAWGIIANAHGGNWDDTPEDWREAAERWRDQYHERLDAALHDTTASPPLDAALLPTLELRRRMLQSPMFRQHIDYLLGWLPSYVQWLADQSDQADAEHEERLREAMNAESTPFGLTPEQARELGIDP